MTLVVARGPGLASLMMDGTSNFVGGSLCGLVANMNYMESLLSDLRALAPGKRSINVPRSLTRETTTLADCQ